VAGVTTKYRISYNSKFFNITSVINLDERDKYLVVKATEGVAV
jgi:head-tail adaptor